MTRRSWPLGGVSAAVLVLVLVLLAVLSVPMRRGASLWEAIAVLPQVVLWVIPVLVALPVLATLALQVRPHWHSVRDRAREDVPTGSLGPWADAIRRADESRFSRSHVVAKLVRLSTSIASQSAVTDEDAWKEAQRRLEAEAPRVAAFLRHDESTLHLSAAQFHRMIEVTVTQLERQQEEE